MMKKIILIAFIFLLSTTSNNLFSMKKGILSPRSEKKEAPLEGKRCTWCAQPAPYRCSSCKKVYYCTKRHQKNDWNVGHNNMCSKKEQRIPKEELVGYLVWPLVPYIIAEFSTNELEKKKKEILENRIEQTHEAYDCIDYAQKRFRAFPIVSWPNEQEIIEDLKSISNKKLDKIKQLFLEKKFNENTQEITPQFIPLTSPVPKKSRTITFQENKYVLFEHNGTTKKLCGIRLIPAKLKVDSKKYFLQPVRQLQTNLNEESALDWNPQGNLLCDPKYSKLYITPKKPDFLSKMVHGKLRYRDGKKVARRMWPSYEYKDNIGTLRPLAAIHILYKLEKQNKLK